jgi:hypothetical protein
MKMRISTPAILLLALLISFSAQATPKPEAQPRTYNPNTHIQNTYAATSNPSPWSSPT